MRQKPIYVEIEMKSDLDTLWEYTQNPSLHKEWDLRFSNITYLNSQPCEKTEVSLRNKGRLWIKGVRYRRNRRCFQQMFI